MSLGTGQEIASAILTGNADVQRIADGNLGIAPEKQSPPLAWLPQTLAAVTLRLHSLDASLKYSEAGFPDREVLMVSLQILQYVHLSRLESSDSKTSSQNCTGREA